jgi:hypothetical protein
MRILLLSLFALSAAVAACGGSDTNNNTNNDPASTPGASGGPGAPGAQPDGGGSTSSACKPQAPEIVAADVPAPTAIVADATHAYWLSFSEFVLMRAPVAGGPPERILEKVFGHDLAIDDQRVYVVSSNGLVGVDKATKTWKKVGHSISTRGMAVKGTNFVWVDSSLWLQSTGPNAVQTKEIRKSNGSSSGFRNVAMDETTVYDATESFKLLRVGLDGSDQGSTEVNTGLSVKVGTTNVYIADPSTPTGGIHVVPKKGGKATTISKGEIVTDTGMRFPTSLVPYDVAVDGETVFALTAFGVQWARPGETTFHSLQSQPTVSGADILGGGNGIAVNATHVFWTGRLPHVEGSGAPVRGQVYRVARCP